MKWRSELPATWILPKNQGCKESGIPGISKYFWDFLGFKNPKIFWFIKILIKNSPGIAISAHLGGLKISKNFWGAAPWTLLGGLQAPKPPAFFLPLSARSKLLVMLRISWDWRMQNLHPWNGLNIAHFLPLLKANTLEKSSNWLFLVKTTSLVESFVGITFRGD